MNRVFTLIISSIFFSISVFAQSPQYSLVTKRTADWCPRCGGWGWTFAKDVMKEFENENVIFWGMHFDGGLANPTSKEMAANFQTAYQPVFYLNQDDINVAPNNLAAKLTELKDNVAALNGFPGLIGVDLETSYDNGTITANVDVEFSDGTESDYNIGLYLIRDNLVAYQASQGNSAVHPNILSASLFNTTFGPLINDGNTIIKDEKYSFSATLDNVMLHSNEVEDLKIAAVVWYKVGDEYTFINGDIEDAKTVSSAEEITNENLKLNVSQGTIEATFDSPVDGDASIQLLNVSGITLPLNNQNVIGNRITANYGTLAPGVYIVSIQNGLTRANRQVYIVE